MCKLLTIQLNGQTRSFPSASSRMMLDQLVDKLGLKPDRIAVEQNGEIVPRLGWDKVQLDQGDRIEIVHFVGGGVSRF